MSEVAPKNLSFQTSQTSQTGQAKKADFFIIGERELVLAFSLTGVAGTIASKREDVLTAFKTATGQGKRATTLVIPRILIMTETAVALIEDDVLDWQKSGKFPLIVEVPSLFGHVKGKKTLLDAIRSAVGVAV